VGTVQGVYRQPPCLTNYRRPPPLLNGCAATADSSWHGSKSASPTPTACYTPIASRPHIKLHPTSNDADHLSYVKRRTPIPDLTCNDKSISKAILLALVTRYPRVADVAKRYPSAPSTSVPSERLFSSAGDLYTDSRSGLSGRLADMLLFIKHNLKFI